MKRSWWLLRGPAHRGEPRRRGHRPNWSAFPWPMERLRRGSFGRCGTVRFHYAEVVLRDAVRDLWEEPSAPHAPARVWRDWVLVAALVVCALLEGLLRSDVVWRPVAIGLAIALPVALLWRRTHPLAVIAVVFGAVFVIDVVVLVVGPGEPVGLYSMTFLVLLPYALLRWGSGREIVIGIPIILAVYVVAVTSDYTGLVDSAAGFVFLMFPAVLGASVRFWATSRERELEQVRLRERELLARELHDTVAHHVSGIVVRAQAGRVVAATDPDAAVEALEVVEEEGSRTLEELRLIVGALRDDGDPDLAPQHGVSDIERLVRGMPGHPHIEVELSGGLDDLRPSVGAAVYRIAQESITNAVRHARHATRVVVTVSGEQDCVRVTVHDDGEPAPGSPAA